LFTFIILYTRNQPNARPLPTHSTVQTQNKSTQTFMPQLGFEITTSASEPAKTIHALDGAATVIAFYDFNPYNFMKDYTTS
jgi:hypothetical protein